MKIYALTQLGQRLARSTQNPDTTAWRLVHYLDSVGHATPDQAASYTGLEEGEASGKLAELRRKGVVREVSTGMPEGGY